MSIAGAPSGRANFTAIWTGTEMIIWGGDNSGESGARYSPATDSWIAMPNSSRRQRHSAVWTGNEMIVWGGDDPNAYSILSAGASYDPKLNTWTALSDSNTPSPCLWHTAVWSGTEMLTFGGYKNFEGSILSNRVFGYVPGLILYLYQRP
jgi:N-acetylneuraminic acid mutarotase